MRETPTTSPLRFAVKFVVIFAVLYSTFEASRGSAFERFVIVCGCAILVAAATRRIGSSQPVKAEGCSSPR
jgi:hypothetical protein